VIAQPSIHLPKQGTRSFSEVCETVETVDSTGCHKSEMSSSYCQRLKDKCDYYEIEGDFYIFYFVYEEEVCEDVLVMP